MPARNAPVGEGVKSQRKMRKVGTGSRPALEKQGKMLSPISYFASGGFGHIMAL
jgi:hypothetical protein